MTDWRAKLAGFAALVVFLALVVLFRMRNWMPFAISGFTFVAVWLSLLPARGRDAALDQHEPPAGRTEADHAIAQLDDAAARLMKLARRAPAADRPLFEHLAMLMKRISGHHRANPDHAGRTRLFRRHVVGRMIASVADYVDLARRAGAREAERLRDISSQLEDFVPALERIDQACLENDLTALEINVEVLNEQLDRRRGD